MLVGLCFSLVGLDGMFGRIVWSEVCGKTTGYSSLSVAMCLPEDGEVFALEFDPKMIEIAQRFWKKGGVNDKITPMIGKANDSLDQLLEDGHEGTFDFAFIDADKENYVHYYEKCMKLLRIGGVIVVDNVLWRGSFCKPRFAVHVISIGARLKKGMDFMKDSRQMKKFNEHVKNDSRSQSLVLPVDDGLYFIRKENDRESEHDEIRKEGRE